MHWTALLAKRFFPPEARVIDDVACISCGYNLRGLRAMGHCPECNAPVGESLFVLARPEVVAGGVRSLGQGFLAVFGLLFVCLPGSPKWSHLLAVGILLCGAAWQLVGLVDLRWRACIENLPVIAARVRVVWIGAIVNAALLLAWLAAILVIDAVPALQTPAAGNVLAGIGSLWAFAWLAFLWAAGWFGHALATIVGYRWIEYEFAAQSAMAILCAALMLPIMFALQAVSSPAAALAMAAVFGLGPALTVLLTVVASLQLANAARESTETMDDAISSGRVAIMPRARGEFSDPRPSIAISDLPQSRRNGPSKA